MGNRRASFIHHSIIICASSRNRFTRHTAPVFDPLKVNPGRLKTKASSIEKQFFTEQQKNNNYLGRSLKPLYAFFVSPSGTFSVSRITPKCPSSCSNVTSCSVTSQLSDTSTPTEHCTKEQPFRNTSLPIRAEIPVELSSKRQFSRINFPLSIEHRRENKINFRHFEIIKTKASFD